MWFARRARNFKMRLQLSLKAFCFYVSAFFVLLSVAISIFLISKQSLIKDSLCIVVKYSVRVNRISHYSVSAASF